MKESLELFDEILNRIFFRHPDEAEELLHKNCDITTLPFSVFENGFKKYNKTEDEGEWRFLDYICAAFPGDSKNEKKLRAFAKKAGSAEADCMLGLHYFSVWCDTERESPAEAAAIEKMRFYFKKSGDAGCHFARTHWHYFREWNLDAIGGSTESPEFKKRIEDIEKEISDYEKECPGKDDKLSKKKSDDLIEKGYELKRKLQNAFRLVFILEDSKDTDVGSFKELYGEYKNRVIDVQSTAWVYSEQGNEEVNPERRNRDRTYRLMDDLAQGIRKAYEPVSREAICIENNLYDRYVREEKVREKTAGFIDEIYKALIPFEYYFKKVSSLSVNDGGRKPSLLAFNHENNISTNVFINVDQSLLAIVPKFEEYRQRIALLQMEAETYGAESVRYSDRASREIDIAGILDIAGDFFKELDPEISGIFEEYADKGYITFKGTNRGVTFYIPELNECRVQINTGLGLEDAFTLVHEFGHVYSRYLASKGLAPGDKAQAFTSPFAELSSLFFEFRFGDYLLKNCDRYGLSRESVLAQIINDMFHNALVSHRDMMFEEKLVDTEFIEKDRIPDIDEIRDIFRDSSDKALGKNYNEWVWDTILDLNFIDNAFPNTPYIYGAVAAFMLNSGVLENPGLWDAYKAHMISCSGDEEMPAPMDFLNALGFEVESQDTYDRFLNRFESIIEEFLTLTDSQAEKIIRDICRGEESDE